MRAYEYELDGCTPAPLASYLKSLAVLRLITEQAGDDTARGCWQDDRFVLRTRLSKQGLREYFLQHYRPTPILSPWNGRAGFLEGEDAEDSTRKGSQVIARLQESTGARFDDYRQLILRIKTVPAIVDLNKVRARLKELEQCKKKGQRIDENERKGLTVRARELKVMVLSSLRSSMPAHFLDWIDACLTVGADRIYAAPLLGSGGNEGSMDLSINHVALLLRLIDPQSDAPAEDAPGLLDQALFNVSAPLWHDVNLGQLSPGRVGGPNMGSGFSGALLENPWSAVLALEGAVLFNASTTRRMNSSADPALSFPFAVSAIPSGEGGMAWDENTRPEVWLPLWDSFATYDELQCLLRESRITLGQRPVRSALDAARAVATLGADRGISRFERYGFFERRGQGYYVASSVGRFIVTKRRNSAAGLISDLDAGNWLAHLQVNGQSKEAPASLCSAVMQLDAALLAMTQQSDRVAVERVLRKLGHIETFCARSSKARALVAPVPKLRTDWVRLANDDSPEFRIALALAGLSLRGRCEGKVIELGMRPHLVPVTTSTFEWDASSCLVTWDSGPLERNLHQLLRRRLLEARRLDAEGDVLRSRTGATLEDVRQFLAKRTDDHRISELVTGLACVNLHDLVVPSVKPSVPPIAAYAVLKPLFTAESKLRQVRLDGHPWLPADRTLHLPEEIPARLASGDIYRALRIAWQRLRAVGAKLPGHVPPHAVGVSGLRLLAALVIPLTLVETARLLEGLDLILETDELEHENFD